MLFLLDTVNHSLEFSIKNIVLALKEINDVFNLGVQLDIQPHYIRNIESHHKYDLNRQKTEVIDFWLHNSDNCSWGTLALAVKRLGTHDQLASQLSQMETTVCNPNVMMSGKLSQRHLLIDELLTVISGESTAPADGSDVSVNSGVRTDSLDTRLPSILGINSNTT